MTDIFDAINDLENFDDEFADEVEGEVYTGELVLAEDSEGEMSLEQAEEITEAIRATATATFVLLDRAHRHKAHKALGYETWAAYVEKEFDMSVQRSYQLLDLSKAVAMIEEATPEGTVVKLTEAQARDIKRELPRITEQVQAETSGKSPEEAAALVDSIIQEAREQKKADEAEVAKKQAAAEAAAEEAKHASLEAAADALLEADRPDGLTDRADDGLLEVEVAGEGYASVSPEDSMHLYNFFNALTALIGLPDPDDFIGKVPAPRREEVNEQLLEATAWLNRFQTLWELSEEE